MFDPAEKALEYTGRSGWSVDPDDGSNTACLVMGEAMVAVEYECRAGDAGRASYIEELRRG
jgi:hypothetical protein